MTIKEIKNINIENMTSSKGNVVPNQFVIRTNEANIFKSYDSIIAIRFFDERKTRLGRNWDYSTTTGKYRNQFLGETINETRAKIASGEYILDENL